MTCLQLGGGFGHTGSWAGLHFLSCSLLVTTSLSISLVPTRLPADSEDQFHPAPYSSPPSLTAPMSLPESSEHPIGLERPKAVSLPYPTAVASGLRSFSKAFPASCPNCRLSWWARGRLRRWSARRGWSVTGRYSFTYGTGSFMWTCAGLL